VVKTQQIVAQIKQLVSSATECYSSSILYFSIGCVLFIFTNQIALIDLSKTLPFFFTAQTNPIKMFRVLFLRSDLSDRSDFARNKTTECLEKPRLHCHLFTFSQAIATWQTIREFLLIYV